MMTQNKTELDLNDQLTKQLPFAKPKKQSKMQSQKQSSKFSYFSKIKTSYCAELQQLLPSCKVLFLYVYRVQMTNYVGNFDEQSESKNNSEMKYFFTSETKNNQIQDYTVRLKQIQQKKNVSGSNMSNFIALNQFPHDRLLNYFQVKVLEIGSSGLLYFGISSQDKDDKSDMKEVLSFQVSVDNLQVLANQSNYQEFSEFDIKLQKGAVFGVGLIYHRNEAFLTFNGKKIKKFKLPNNNYQERKKKKQKKLSSRDFVKEYTSNFYPHIGVASKSLQIQIIFENSAQNFTFPFMDEYQILQQKLIEQQIPKQVHISQQSLYGLVLNYMKFNGFSKSDKLMQEQMSERSMRFYPQNTPIHDQNQYKKIMKNIVGYETRYLELAKQKKIKKKVKKGLTQRSKKSCIVQSDEEQELDFDSIHQETNSKYLNAECQIGQMCPFQVRSGSITIKNTKLMDHMDQIQKKPGTLNQEQFYRKNKAQIRNQNIRKTEEEKFKNDRLKIVKNIKEGKLDEAWRTLSKSYHRIVKEQRYLQTFFKAHIFLKHFQQEGLQSALQFIKKQQSLFTQFQNYLFPFYNLENSKTKRQNPTIFRALREILLLICVQNSQQFDLFKQLQVFSNFVNKILCQESGFMSSSKLQLVLNHYEQIREQTSELELPVGGLNLVDMQDEQNAKNKSVVFEYK